MGYAEDHAWDLAQAEKYKGTDMGTYYRVHAEEDQRSHESMIRQAQGDGKWAAFMRGALAADEFDRNGMQQFLQAQAQGEIQRKAEESAQLQRDRGSLMKQVESAFQSMVSSCVNNGQVAMLMSIKSEWISKMSSEEVVGYDEYMNHWQSATGTT